MKVLHLLRHAKSSWYDPNQDDHERPLAPRGARAAALIGRHLRGRGFAPDLVLCSTARRAVDTLAILAAQLDPPGLAAETDADLYLQSDRLLLNRLRQVPDPVGSVLLVGHNPGIQNLALSLAGSGPPGILDRLAGKYPTAGFATLSFDIESWHDLAAGTGRLEEFLVPRELG